MSFAWSPKTSVESNPFVVSIEPKEILYDFDGPMLFSTVSGHRYFLCYKTDENDSLSQYLVVPTNPAVIKELKSGSVSLRSALVQPWAWVLAADANFRTQKSWPVSAAEIPDDLLPEPGYGIYPSHGIISERSSVAPSAYLSIHFTGGEARNRTLPLGVVKCLFDEVYNSLWTIFAPSIQEAAPHVSEKMLRRGFSIPTHEPAFASLLISIEQPRLDFSNFIHKPEVDMAHAQRNIEQAHKAFLNSAAAIAEAVQKGNLSASLPDDDFYALEAVAHLIPGRQSFFDSVKIQGTIGGKEKEKKLVIDVESGRRIREAYRLALQGNREVRGKIVEINSFSFSFIVQNRVFRKTTCAATTEEIRKIFPDLKPGMRIWVKGLLTRRKRRDLLRIESISLDGEKWVG